jgi:Tfp pilus assembly protein PilO
MTLATWLNKSSNAWVEVASRRWPAASLRWRNRNLFAAVEARWWRAILVCSLSMIFVGMGWQMLSTAGWMHSHQLELEALEREQATFKSNASLQQIKADALALAHEKTKAVQLEYQMQLDDLILAWPNSALRTQLIHRLQNTARLQNLRIEKMTLTPLPNEHGFEAGTLSFALKGTQSATYIFWHALNQLFQNDIWTALVWRRMPEGHYSLEGQLHLLWDAQDAFTDTGVELQADSRKVSEIKVLQLKSHLWPDQSLSQMRLVGTAQSADPVNKELAWTLLQSGRQIQAVQPGHYLGIENRRVLSLDAQGLWLEGGLGTELSLPFTLLAWEKGLP